MMMKNLIKTFWFILAIAWPSVVMATSTTLPGSIINTACIQRNWNEACDSADISTYACLSITWNHNEIPSNWNVEFTCRASDNTIWHDFEINCGNGGVWTGYRAAGVAFKYTCHYSSATTPYTVSCLVDGETSQINPACTTTLGYWIPENDCWDGVLDDWEHCDLWWAYNQMVECSDSSCTSAWDSKYYCLNCAIVYRWNFVYEPAECRYSDTPISVMNNEIVPYWWKLYDKNTQTVTSNTNDCYEGYEWNTLLLDKPGSKNEKERVRCEFAVYNWEHNQTPNSNGYVTPMFTFEEDCFNYDEKYHNEKIYEYFKKHHHWENNNHPDWLKYNSVNAITDKHSEYEFGEYKLVLQRVKYQVCDGSKGEWKEGQKYWAICEVNFAVTKPYIMQVSTFGVNPVATDNSEFLDDYYDMYDNKILTKTDLNSVIKTDNTDYATDSNVESKFDEFKKKYESLAVKLDINSTIKNSKKGSSTLNKIFATSDGWKIEEIKKVPGKSIYFIKWNWTLVLSQDKIEYLTTAFTLIVQWMDVEIEWNFLKYAMILTDKKMSFKDAWEEGVMGCADGWQVVQWIYVALDGFKAAKENLLNTDKDEYWCPWWGLHVKWVLIWENIQDISKNKRSQLNSWFNATSSSQTVLMRERRQKIIEWASLLIEYSPSLWKTLPPWAEIFTENLEVYRK